MSSDTAARLLVEAAPEFGQGARRFTVACPWSASELIHVPDNVAVIDEQLLTILLAMHADDCGWCDLEPLWRRVDPKLRSPGGASAGGATARLVSDFAGWGCATNAAPRSYRACSTWLVR